MYLNERKGEGYVVLRDAEKWRGRSRSTGDCCSSFEHKNNFHVYLHKSVLVCLSILEQGDLLHVDHGAMPDRLESQ
jgi:hypothetical protein